MDADLSNAAFEQAYREILETARRQVSSYPLSQPNLSEGQYDWWEYSPHRLITTDGSGPVTTVDA